ncbi:unnamed protein product, partial [Discosporangium mesarthrocarpum]
FSCQSLIEQLILIFKVVGSPDPSEVSHVTNPQAIRFLQAVKKFAKVSTSILCPEHS